MPVPVHGYAPFSPTRKFPDSAFNPPAVSPGTVSGGVTDQITITLAGTSGLSATVTPYQEITVALAGTSTLAGTVTPYKLLTVTLAGTSALNATLTAYKELTVTLSGTSSLTATVTPYKKLTASLAGTSSLAATVTPETYITVRFAGASSLTVGQIVPPAPAPKGSTAIGGRSLEDELYALLRNDDEIVVLAAALL